MSIDSVPSLTPLRRVSDVETGRKVVIHVRVAVVLDGIVDVVYSGRGTEMSGVTPRTQAFRSPGTVGIPSWRRRAFCVQRVWPEPFRLCMIR